MRKSPVLIGLVCVVLAAASCDDGSDPLEDGGAGADADADSDSDADADSDSDTDTDSDAGHCGTAVGLVNPGEGEDGHTEIATWQMGRTAALSINFDDSTPGQALRGVPAMIDRGLAGTWFINPGVESYADFSDVWEEDAPAGGQELANHSMDHAGAADYADAEYQIGEVAQIIWDAYPPGRSPIIGFNSGGGTTWNVTADEYASLLETYFCVERLYSSGIYPGTLATTMSAQLLAAFTTGSWVGAWGNIHFHGICDPADTVNCVCDTEGQSSNCREYEYGVNSGAVSRTQFELFLDFLMTDPFFSTDVWIDGFAAVHKYRVARDAATPALYSSGGDELILCLTSALDPALYDEPLTLGSVVPSSWTGCAASQGGEALGCRLEDGVAWYEARLDRGDIHLSPL
jgi:hypothetical protein